MPGQKKTESHVDRVKGDVEAVKAARGGERRKEARQVGKALFPSRGELTGTRSNKGKLPGHKYWKQRKIIS